MRALEKELIFLKVPADTKEEAIGLAVKKMEALGYVGKDYLGEVLKRERAYPTGLPSEGVCTAVPHAFCETVKKTCVAVIQLQKTVEFYSMEDGKTSLPVGLVFVMANAGGGAEHLEDLQELMGIFSRKQLLLDLKEADSREEFMRIYSEWENYPEE